MNEISKLKVLYNGKIVGYLELIQDVIYFQYDSEWEKSGFSISPKSLPLTHQLYVSKSNYFNGLFGVFFDSLPSGWAELVTTRKFAELGIDYRKLNPLTKLSLITDLSFGGLTYIPSQMVQDNDIDSYSLSEYSKIANELLNSNIIKDTSFLCSKGGSSGGTRPKSFYIYQNDCWVVKFPCRYDPENISQKEYIANQCAKECGIHVNEFGMFESDGHSFFGSKRFDRNKDRRIHMVSASSLLEVPQDLPILDYKHLFQLVKLVSACRKEDMEELYRRMCFNVFFQNKDDHGGNFSFLYSEERKGYILSPFYDITPTPDKAEHETAVLGNGNPTIDDLIELGQMFDIKEAKEKAINIKKICDKYSE